MEENEIKILLKNIQNQQCESNTIELKEAHKGCPSKLYDTFSSFSNQDEGGIIVFGMDEKEYKVIGVYDSADLQKKISEKCLEMVPVIRPFLSVASIDGKSVVTAEIRGEDYAKRPVYYGKKGINKGSYVRVGDCDEPMTDYEIYKYEAYRSKIYEDRRVINDGWVMKNQPLIDAYLKKIKEGKPNLFENVSDSQLLSLQQIEKNSLPTLAGLLVFSDYPQALFPGLCITAVVYAGTQRGDVLEDETRFLDNQRIIGSIPSMLDDALSFIVRNTKTRTVIDSNGKRRDQSEYPMRAVREAILNALIHRDYSFMSEGTPIRIELYNDRLEIISSGGMFGRVSVEKLGKESPETRNSTLTAILEILGISENRYSGIPTMRKEMEKAHLPAPEFVDNHRTFKTVFRNQKMQDLALSSLNEQEEKVIAYCQVAKTRKEIAENLQKSYTYASNSIIKPMIDKGILIKADNQARGGKLIVSAQYKTKNSES